MRRAKNDHATDVSALRGQPPIGRSGDSAGIDISSVRNDKCDWGIVIRSGRRDFRQEAVHRLSQASGIGGIEPASAFGGPHTAGGAHDQRAPERFTRCRRAPQPPAGPSYTPGTGVPQERHAPRSVNS